MPRFIPILALIVLAAPAAEESSTRLLQRHGVRADAEGLGWFLLQHRVGSPLEQWTRAHVETLGHPDFHRRERIHNWLAERPLLSMRALAEAERGEDAEIVLRARRLRRQRLLYDGELLRAAYRTMAQFEIRGLAAHVLGACETHPPEPGDLVPLEAMRRTARGADADPLTRLLPTLTPVQRQLAAVAIAAGLLLHADTDKLRALLDSEFPDVWLGAGYTLAQATDRRGFEVLVDLLSHPDLAVRKQAFEMLRGVTKHEFDYRPSDVPAVRDLAVARWREWIDITGPLRPPDGEGPPAFRRVLCCVLQSAEGEVMELSATGQPRWRKRLGHYTWAGQSLANGNRLFVEPRANRVTEYNPRGEIVWRRNVLPKTPYRARRLDNGNTLVACRKGNRVVEVDRDGRTVWRVAVGGGPTDAHRLPGGNTLVACREWGTVCEISPEGETVWQIEGLDEPCSARRLGNGNTLVAQVHGRKVVEFNPEMEAVSTWHAPVERGRPFDAIRLDNGHTLVATSKALFEIDRDHRMVTVLLERAVCGIELIP